mmetsp:Transcript_9991/g.24688  ORF Transcript_9991/g.24688 Transcript_9991/m.24688 type:complete len:351 (+) Transcript_9991:727-1779(+)
MEPPRAPKHVPENIAAKSQGRLMKEQKMMHEQAKELSELGIYVRWDEDLLTKVKALIIGPPDTPYQHGFFFFDVEFPANYPYSPPKVQFRTGDGRVRFNPNLYVEGKVCLSILGTWQGPGWTSICNLRSVLITIQSLMSSHPITNEPGHENQIGKKDDVEYNKILTYETVNVGVLRMMQNPPKGFEIFKPEMGELFRKNFLAFEEVLRVYEPEQGKSLKAPLWMFSVKYDPKTVRTQLDKILKELNKKTAQVEKQGSASDEGGLSNSGSGVNAGKATSSSGAAAGAGKKVSKDASKADADGGAAGSKKSGKEDAVAGTAMKKPPATMKKAATSDKADAGGPPMKKAKKEG